ncbi:MAG: GSCFA domain-containing protein [Bacteroidales bacterium]|nr:GSCFA domain-containing protein [Bacteroidales bacterium]
MQFKTTINIPHSVYEISHAERGMLIGSCFTDNIGKRLHERKFHVLVNPLGTVYNPASISNTIDLLVGTKTFDDQQVFFSNDVWQSYYLHTSFSSVNKSEVFEKFCSKKTEYQEKFEKLDYLFLTLGTAWIYELRSSGEIVSNCHKTPASQFKRRKLSVTECVSLLSKSIDVLRAKNPFLQVIFTVSPIRHWKDGAHENQLSKSTLFLAIDELQRMKGNIMYFPAYELLMDELRDYRFYDEDMLHPSKVAVEFIWEKFSETFFSQSTLILNKQINSIQKAIEHRPFNMESDSYKLFVKNQIETCTAIEKNSCISMKEEIQLFKNRL